LQNSSDRILKIIFALWFAFAAGLGICNLPWHPPVILDLKDQIGQEIVLKVQKSNDDIVIHNLIPTTEKSTYRFLASKVLSIESKDPTDSPILLEKVQSNERVKPNNVLEATLIFSVLLFFVLWALFENFLPFHFSPKYVYVALGNLSLLGLIFWGGYPGFLGFDSFEALRAIAAVTPSIFLGDFYFSMNMIFFQIWPEVWALTIINFLTIFFCLTSFSNMAIRMETLKYYLIGLLIFFAYPVNILLSLYTVRDISASWLMAYVLIKFYDLCLSENSSLKANLNFGIAFAACCLLRKEAAWVMLPLFSLLILFRFRFLLRSFAITSILTLAFIWATQLNNTNQRHHDNYEVTLLINPLSYILKEKYPAGLPSDIDAKLGPYFKNEYLINHQTDYEITPFHRGGVNNGISHNDYLQFRKATFEIILQNWDLFLINRFKIAGYHFGYPLDFAYIASDLYLDSLHRKWQSSDSRTFFSSVEQQISASRYHRPGWGHRILNRMMRIKSQYSHIFSTYVIPMLLILLALIYYPRSFLFNSVCFILLCRIMLVILTAPAGLFKYQYPLWIFAPFSLLILVAEKRRKLTNAPVPFKTL